MSSNRQDAWSQDEDVILAEVVLRHIREGGTQLKAFEEVGRKLSRTSAACGFRWNSFVRKQYKSGIELAKKQRKQSKKHSSFVKKLPKEDNPEVLPGNVEMEQRVDPTFSMGSIIQYLQKAEVAVRNEELTKVENGKLKERISQLSKELERCEARLTEYKSKYELLEDDHKALLTIFEKARRMAVLQDNDEKVKFQMDKNGNLQRVIK
ncbi:RsfA family transcriptional regulator [Rossellomorea aquimaris]|uniref:RsfA family transcriptional regulator n=1 Tax=Rossellomorea aquimaris TaxID=189382 RepID=UPI001CD34C35|nr:RsfA family transcriptional regulator [Rossellomorea aquimaris]MCA1053405.1 RsfA family transcriptional regulator [Rossellomorea aquimaris]